MAKVTGPAHSVSASGTFASRITFDKRGIAHAPNAPGNQLTAGRGNARQIFLSMSRALQLCQASVKTTIKAAARPKSDWRAWLIKRAIGEQRSAWNSTGLIWATLTEPQQEAWDTAAAAAGFAATAIAYASDDPISAGLAMFQLASALYAADLVTEPGEPGADNASEWAAAITGAGGGDPIGDTLRADAVAYWKLDEASGTRVDATGRGNDLEPVNNPGSVSGKIGNAARFTILDSSYLQGPDSADLRMGATDLEIVGWVRLRNKAASQWQTAFDAFLTDIERETYLAYNGYADRLVFGTCGHEAEADNFGAPPENEWLFFDSSLDTAIPQIGLRINNTALDTWPISSLDEGTAVSFRIGTDPWGDEAEADVDELGIWKRLLTDEERAYLWNGGAGRALFN